MYATTERWRPGQRSAEGGAPPPLFPLPLFPGLPGYRDFDEELRHLGFRHAMDVLQPDASGTADGFRVLDGLWFPGRGMLWHRADAGHCRAAGEAWRGSGAPRAGGAARLAARLGEVAADDPAALRRLVLYQLCCRLKDSPAVDEAAAVALGVDAAEARPLAEAVAAHFPGPGPAREAAEEIADAWRAGRLRRSLELAERLPAFPDEAPHADPFLAALREEMRDAAEATGRLLDEARRLRERGEHRAAAKACLAACRQAVDEPRARAALLATAVSAADAETRPRTPGAAHADEAPPGARRPGVTAVLESGTVRLSWRAAAASGVRYQVLRFPDGAPGEAVEVAMVTQNAAEDPAPPVATPLRYAVIPWRGDRMAGVAKAGPGPDPLLPAPEGFRSHAVPDGVRLSWRAHPAAVRSQAMRLAGAGRAEAEVPSRREELTDRPLPAGAHHYRVRCGYPGPDGRTLWSGWRLAVARAEEWPAPIEGKLVLRRLPDGRVELSWPRPARGETRLVPWPGGPPPHPGEDVCALVASAPRGPASDGVDGEAPPRVTLAPPPRAVTRLMAVSVLGERAVAGPAVVLETPGTAEGLHVRRLDARRAEVRFRWPEPAVLARLTWRGGDRAGERRLARSQYPGGGGLVEIPVSRAEHLVTITPVARPDADLAECGTAQVRLPAMPLPAAVLARAWTLARPVARRAGMAATRGWARVIGSVTGSPRAGGGSP
ncbi:hypothetical protein [Streptomyces sp. 6N223]|uniref:hypothetical protein n=1 Tax=Streptomyces sp. 6N223 TaxID=3457412 RepID=UPI003FCF70D2